MKQANDRINWATEVSTLLNSLYKKIILNEITGDKRRRGWLEARRMINLPNFAFQKHISDERRVRSSCMFAVSVAILSWKHRNYSILRIQCEKILNSKTISELQTKDKRRGFFWFTSERCIQVIIIQTMFWKLKTRLHAFQQSYIT